MINTTPSPLTRTEKRALYDQKVWNVYTRDFFGDWHTNNRKTTRDDALGWLHWHQNHDGMVWMTDGHAVVHDVKIECDA